MKRSVCARCKVVSTSCDRPLSAIIASRLNEGEMHP